MEHHQHIASFLHDRAEQAPNTQAVVFPERQDSAGKVAYTHITNQDLLEQTLELSAALHQYGIRKGDRIALMVKPSLTFFPLTFALFTIGAVPVFIDPAIGRHHMKNCLREAKPSGFIGIPKAHIARLILGWGHSRFRNLITVGGGFGYGGKTLESILENSQSNHSYPEPIASDKAAILFTSGSTGTPKGALYTHKNFLGQIAALKNTYQIQPGEKDLCTFPLFALFAPALGMTAIIPKMDFTAPGKVDPNEIFTPIRDFGVTNLFGSPALLRRLIPTIRDQGLKLDSLNRVVSAGAPVPYQVLIDIKGALKESADVFTPYGATESLPVASIGAGEILGKTAARTKLGAGVCVGRPTRNTDVMIIKITDSPLHSFQEVIPLPPEAIGEIMVSGPQVTEGYYGNPKATAMAKVKDRRGNTWHRMGDVGFLDRDGLLWFCGRKSHRIETKEGALFTIPLESIMTEHPQVDRTALVGVGTKGKERPVLFVETKKPSEHLKRELQKLAEKNPKTEPIKDILFHNNFPVDIRHNSKIYREKLKSLAEEHYS